MVLEELIRPQNAKKSPASIFIMAFIISSISIWIFYYIFPSGSSVLPLAFLTIAFVPLIHRIFLYETEKEIETPGFAPGFIARHFDLFLIYTFLFFGLIASYTFWFVVLPQDDSVCENNIDSILCIFPTREKIFADQITTYNAIDPNNPMRATGQATALEGVGFKECKNPQSRSIEKCAMFIFNNNYFVMVLAIFFSFLFGAGAIFLIGWNASVIGTVVGAEIVFDNLSSGLSRLIGIFPHGIFEIGAYFIAAIAGGIISTALTTKKYSAHGFEVILKDTVILILIAFGFLIIGSIIEATTIINPALAEMFFIGEIILLLIIAAGMILKRKKF